MVEKALIGYYVIAAACLFLLFRTQPRERPAFALLLLAVPFFGLPFALLKLVAAKQRPDEDGDRFRELLDEPNAEQRIFERPDVDRELNRVPLEEALLINDLSTRRRLLLDVIKEDLNEEVMPLLEVAVANEDTETSHYAVTAALEIKRKLMLSIQESSVQYDRDKSSLKTAQTYAEAVKKYIDSGFMDKRTKMSQQLLYSQLLEQLIASEACTETLVDDMIQVQVELENYDRALAYCELYLEKYPTYEKAYLSTMKVHYLLKQSGLFYETLQRLKDSKIPVSNDGLNVIRYWSNKGA